MLNFYNIKQTTDAKVIGPEYPQMSCISISVKDGLDKLSNNKGKRIVNPGKIHNLILPARSKKSDVISCSLGAGGDFIISKRFYKILKQLNCSSVQFFPLSFMYKKELVVDFIYVHFIYELEKFISFKKSEYDEYFIPGLNNNKPKSYSAFSKLIDQHKKLNHFRLNKTILQKKFPPSEDFFVLSFANQNKYISQRLFNIITQEEITGLEIEPAWDIC